MDTVEYYQSVLKTLKDKKEGRDEESLRRAKYDAEHYDCCGAEKIGPHKCNCINADEEKGFKNRFVQHYPNYYTVEDEHYFTLNFNTQEELLTCNFVARFRRGPFYRYSIAPKQKYCAASLMVEYHEGKKWWCLGFLKSTDGLTLPKWEPVYGDED